MHYYNFNIGDYMKHTLHLTPEEDLAYRRLLDMYYDTESPIPSNIPSVSRRLRMDSKVVESVLNEFFELTEEGYKNYRADGEIADYHKFLEKQKSNGRLGGRPKKGKKPIDNPSLTQAEPKKSLNNKQQTTNNKQINTTPKVVTPEGVSDDLWNDFLIYRKRLKAPITDRVLARLVKEANLAKMPLSEVLETIMFKGWRSFDATWAIQTAQKASEMPLGSDKQIEEAYRVECGGNPSTARFNSYFDMKKFILDQRDKKRKVA
jgi:uncharacterized protein YdaU (DUF1376 family)